jgi:hypothetical protein
MCIVGSVDVDASQSIPALDPVSGAAARLDLRRGLGLTAF